MRIHLIRNATIKVQYAGRTFLIDPMLAEQGAYPGLPGTVNSDRRNPTVNLSTPMEDILAADAVIVTHTHADHWDEAAKELLPKHLPVSVQHDADAQLVKASGFNDVRLLSSDSTFDGIQLVRTVGQHGSDMVMSVIGELLGQVSGVVFKHADEKTLYLAGDTIFNDDVRDVLTAHTPDVVILNSGDAQVPGLGSLIMNEHDVLEVHRATPRAMLIAAHMEALNHAMLTRDALRSFAEERGFATQLLVPDDGQAYDL